MKPESHCKIIVHAKKNQTRYCCEFIKMLDSLNRKDKSTHDNVLRLINKYIISG